MARKAPPTRFPDAVAVSYYREIKRLVDELGKLTLRVFDEQIKEQIKLYQRNDSAFYKTDGPLDVIQQAIDLIKALSLGIFASSTVKEIATRFLNSLNQYSENIARNQGKIKGIDPTQYEPWLDEYMRSSITENVSYISTIRDEFFPKIEAIIYQGVKTAKALKKSEISW